MDTNPTVTLRAMEQFICPTPATEIRAERGILTITQFGKSRKDVTGSVEIPTSQAIELMDFVSAAIEAGHL